MRMLEPGQMHQSSHEKGGEVIQQERELSYTLLEVEVPQIIEVTMLHKQKLASLKPVHSIFNTSHVRK